MPRNFNYYFPNLSIIFFHTLKVKVYELGMSNRRQLPAILWSVHTAQLRAGGMWPAGFIWISNKPLTTCDLVEGDNPINSLIIKAVRNQSFQSGFSRLFLYFSLGQPQHRHCDQTAPCLSCVWRNMCLLAGVFNEMSHIRPGQARWRLACLQFPPNLWKTFPFTPGRKEFIFKMTSAETNNQTAACSAEKHLPGNTYSTSHRTALRSSVCEGFPTGQTDLGWKGLSQVVFKPLGFCLGQS